jgi:hypothetical protein
MSALRFGTEGIWVYGFFLLFPLAWALAPRLPARLRSALPAITAFAFFLFLGFRYRVSADWEDYVRLFDRDSAAGLGSVMAHRDLAYRLLDALAGRLGLGFWAVNAVGAAIFSTGLVAFAQVQRRPAVALTIAIPVLILMVGMNFHRQMIAFGLLMWAWSRLERDPWWRPAALVAAAGLFHWSALIFLPLTAVSFVRKPIPARYLLVAAAISGLAAAAFLAAFPAVADYINFGYSRGAPFRAVPTILALTIYLLAGRRLALPDQEAPYLSWFAAVGVFGLCIMPVIISAADRLILYPILLQMVIFSRTPDLFAPGPARKIVGAAIVAAAVLMAAVWLAFSSGYRACMTPYRSFLLEPELLTSPVLERDPATDPCLAAKKAVSIRRPREKAPAP